MYIKLEHFINALDSIENKSKCLSKEELKEFFIKAGELQVKEDRISTKSKMREAKEGIVNKKYLLQHD